MEKMLTFPAKDFLLIIHVLKKEVGKVKYNYFSTVLVAYYF